MQHEISRREPKLSLSIREAADRDKLVIGHELSGLQNGGGEIIPWYSERSIIMAHKQKDVVLVNKPVDQRYLMYLDEIGLGPKKVISLDSENIYEGVAKSNLKKMNAAYSSFISRDADKAIVDKLAVSYIGNDETITARYYDKGSFKEIVKSLGVKMAPGDLFIKTGDHQADMTNLVAMMHKHVQLTGEVILRETNGEGGFNILTAKPSQIQSVAEQVMHQGEKYLVESKLSVKESPCVMGIVNEDGPTLVAISNQILKNNGTSYAGTRLDYHAPIDRDIYNTFTTIGKRMHEDGYRGPMGIDFIITEDNKKIPCECNARVNGSFYPHELRQRLFEKGIEFPIVYSIKTSITDYKSFSDLIEKNPTAKSLLYTGKEEPGIFPYNTSTIPFGELTFAILAKSHDQVKDLKKAFKTAIRKPPMPKPRISS